MKVSTMPQEISQGHSLLVGPSEADLAENTSSRNYVILLHSLVIAVLSYYLEFSRHALLSVEIKGLAILGLLLSIPGVWLLPKSRWGIKWVVGILVVGDTICATAIFILSGNASSDIYLIYYLIILINALTTDLRQMAFLSTIVCVVYGVFFYWEVWLAGSVVEESLLRVPVLLILAAFYATSSEKLHSERKRRLKIEQELRTKDEMRQVQKLESIGRLAAGVAHDFNNQLTVIGGYSSLLLTQLEDDNSLRPQLKEINLASERAAFLTKQLLAFSRKQVLQPKVLNLNTVIGNLVTMMRRLIGEDISLETMLSPELGRSKLDPGQIEQIIMNLAANARDAMPHGGKLIIETHNIDLYESYTHCHVSVHPGRYVMLAISDTGCGMDTETLSHIFEPFFTTKDPGKGTGLGLATVYGIVKQSGGYIFVYSEAGKGTTFKLYFPRVEQELETLTPSVPSGEPQRGSETILLVEDEEAVRGLVRTILKQNGYTVLDARDVEEAVQINEKYEGPIHLLLTDVVMPQMSGRELIRHLGSSRPNMRVLYMSGYSYYAIIRNGALQPGTVFLQKPFTPGILLAKVRESLNG